MSDFEYEYNSSSDNDDNISDNISDINYSDDELNSDTIKNNFIIDMDDTMDDTIDNTKHQKNYSSIINKVNPIINSFDSLFNNEKTDDNTDDDSNKKTTYKTKKIQFKKKEEKKEDKKEDKKEEKTELNKKSKNKDEKEEKKEEKKEIKFTKKEQNFEFNQETIDFYTKDLDFKKILLKKSPFTNDIQVICLLLKHKIISDYCCSIDKCKVKNLWLDKPIQLILHRKNNIQNDLSSFNLELICGNCYLSMYGLDIFKKKEKEIIFKCETCGFPLVKFNNTRKKKGICLSCEKKMNNVFNETIDGKFYTRIQGLYNDNPLLSEENKEANYYKNIGNTKFSSSSISTYKKPNHYNSSQTSKEDKSKTKPETISLNLTLPKIDDLLI